jgi:mannose-6-phosphate isomerase-like protein (cupin superfamily)
MLQNMGVTVEQVWQLVALVVGAGLLLSDAILGLLPKGKSPTGKKVQMWGYFISAVLLVPSIFFFSEKALKLVLAVLVIIALVSGFSLRGDLRREAKKLNPEQLKAIADGCVAWLQQAGEVQVTRLMRGLTDYHNGFYKGRLPNHVVEGLAAAFGATVADVQAELVLVKRDMTWAYHGHAEATAYCVALGFAQHVRSPHLAFALVNGKRAPYYVGDVVVIPNGVPHTFTVDEGGWLIFLSVQNPPIDGEHDDFHEVVLPLFWVDVASVAELV